MLARIFRLCLGSRRSLKKTLHILIQDNKARSADHMQEVWFWCACAPLVMLKCWAEKWEVRRTITILTSILKLLDSLHHTESSQWLRLIPKLLSAPPSPQLQQQHCTHRFGYKHGIFGTTRNQIQLPLETRLHLCPREYQQIVG